jgi:hypothetical protein
MQIHTNTSKYLSSVGPYACTLDKIAVSTTPVAPSLVKPEVGQHS